jgi:hypothetical protein
MFGGNNSSAAAEDLTGISDGLEPASVVGQRLMGADDETRIERRSQVPTALQNEG